MKKIFLLLVLGLVIFIAVEHQRLYLRDPLAHVKRDGVEQQAYVMINYSNDILLNDSSAGKHRLYLVQNWNKAPGFLNSSLKCFHGLACLTDADQATATIFTAGSRGQRPPVAGVTMTNKQVEFVDEDGALVRVTLR